MKNPAFIILLAVSIAFNIFFATGYLLAEKSVKEAQNPLKRVEMAAERLSLSEEQKKELVRIVSEARKRFNELKREKRDTVKLFRTELGKADPDIDLLKSAMKKIERDSNLVRKEMLAQWKKFYSSLSEKQKKRVKQMLKNHPRLKNELLIPKFSNERG